MRKTVFLTSHLGSGSYDLLEILNNNNRVLIQNKGSAYDHVDSLDWLYSAGHKNKTVEAVYGDHLLFNSNITNRSLYKLCQFIFFIRPAKDSLNEIHRITNYTENNILNYYTFRLRRIYEIAKRSNSVLLTWDNLAAGRGFDLIEDYLNLNEPLQPEFTHFAKIETDKVSYKVVEQAQEVYEKYLYALRNLDNLKYVDTRTN